MSGRPDSQSRYHRKSSITSAKAKDDRWVSDSPNHSRESGFRSEMKKNELSSPIEIFGPRDIFATLRRGDVGNRLSRELDLVPR